MEQQEPQIMAENPSSSSLTERITGIFTSPNEIYGEVASLPVQSSSWVVPYVSSLILALIVTYTLFSNESLRHQIYDMQAQKMEKAVQEGKMSASQMEKAREQMEGSGPGIFLAIGSVSAMVMISVMLFGGTLALWLAAKFTLKAGAGYSKMLEVFGLASVIGILGSIVTILLMYVFDSLYASPSPALAILDSYDHNNKLHGLLSSLNVFSIWEAGVIGVGLSKISGKSTGTGLGVAYGLWGLWVIVAVMFSFGLR